LLHGRTNPDHRRTVVASLVEGVYSLAHDNQGNENGPVDQLWWEYFDFQLLSAVKNDTDYSIITAIYKYKNPDSSSRNVPTYVIAFRGIIPEQPTISQDLRSCFSYILNDVEGDTRFRSAMDAVWDKVVSVGAPNVWLAGHSLGSAVALVVGKKMVMERSVFLETYLFNPPFIGLPVELIKGERLKQAIRIGIVFVKAGVARAAKAHHHQQDNSLAKLSQWFPHLFVNRRDPICAEYTGHFQNRKNMKLIGAGKIERFARNISIMSALSRIVTGGDSEALHLLPSAHLTINKGSTDLAQAHSTNQWWDPNFSCDEFEVSGSEPPHDSVKQPKGVKRYYKKVKKFGKIISYLI
jgi:hypothetical protein